MGRARLNAGDLAAIALGGVLGAVARWAVLSLSTTETSAGWFVYARNTTLTVGSNGSGLEQSESELPIMVSTSMPWDTLAVNLAGCVLLGALSWLLVRSTLVSRRLLLATATGFCGSLTTFSTYAVEVATRLRARTPLSDETAGLDIRIERDLPGAMLYVILSIAGAAIAFWLGRFIAKRVVTSPRNATIGGAA